MQFLLLLINSQQSLADSCAPMNYARPFRSAALCDDRVEKSALCDLVNLWGFDVVQGLAAQIRA